MYVLVIGSEVDLVRSDETDENKGGWNSPVSGLVDEVWCEEAESRAVIDLYSVQFFEVVMGDGERRVVG